jgi:hypothetical protein
MSPIANRQRALSLLRADQDKPGGQLSDSSVTCSKHHMAEVGHSLAEIEADNHKSITLDSTVKAPLVEELITLVHKMETETSHLFGYSQYNFTASTCLQIKTLLTIINYLKDSGVKRPLREAVMRFANHMIDRNAQIYKDFHMRLQRIMPTMTNGAVDLKSLKKKKRLFPHWTEMARERVNFGHATQAHIPTRDHAHHVQGGPGPVPGRCPRDR